MKQNSALLATLACTLIVAGCSLLQSPAVGDWSGTMTASPQGGVIGAIATGFVTAVTGNSASLSLRADGTGYVKMMSAPEQQITWKADGDRVLIYGIDTASNKEDATISPSPNAPKSDAVIARFSDDKKTLTVDAGSVQFSLAKQAAK